MCKLIIRRRIETKSGSKKAYARHGNTRAHPGQKSSLVSKMLLDILGIGSGYVFVC